ncbi:Hypothetical predicted protein [Pelobates cultripes]|uniref:SH2 domain-containing protein n=1 Tax=Pelobates cultripes TaxID=61616 RepID=A0AAD1RK97_PELCU|nr:Hypothetical predicted protein [Pelobates cultripes]
MEKGTKLTRPSLDKSKDVVELGSKNMLEEQSKNECLPEWFHGLMSRRGKERCRHFLINQLTNGSLVVSGDNYSHSSLPALISYYQSAPFEPFGEKLTQCYVKFSDYNRYDEISPATEEQKKLDSTKHENSQMKIQNSQVKNIRSTAQGCAPPLPERKGNQYKEEEKNIYAALPKKYHPDPSKSALATKYPEEMVKEGMYSQSNKTNVVYSLAKETQMSQNNFVKTSTPQVLYSQVMLDKGLPSALGHLQSNPNQEMTSLGTMSPKSNMKEISQYKVMEMKFASSLQCTDMINTFSNEASKNYLLADGVEMPGRSFLHSATVAQAGLSNTYEQIPYCTIKHMGDQISNISVSCTTYDQITTQTSKELVTGNMYEKVPLQNSSNDNTYEMVTRSFSKPPGKKPNVVNKNEKQKRFFFAEKKK